MPQIRFFSFDLMDCIHNETQVFTFFASPKILAVKLDSQHVHHSHHILLIPKRENTQQHNITDTFLYLLNQPERSNIPLHKTTFLRLHVYKSPS